MFFDKILVENRELRQVWRAGFGRMEELEENSSIPIISTNIAECVGSEDPNPRSRLSLRTSAVLVEGAARIYRQELSRLLEDLSEVDRVMANRNERKLTDSDADTSTESSNPSVPYDTPEHMRRQIPRQSDVSLQRPDIEFMAIFKSPDLNHYLSSISKSSDTQQSSLNDIQNDQSAKRRKMTDQTNLSTEYPSSLDLTTDRNSEDPISEEEPDLADKNNNILLIYEQPTKNANAELNSYDEAASRTDQNETEKSSNEENSGESLYSATFTDKFDFVAAFPNHPYSEISEIVEERADMADKNSEKQINDADTRNKSDENVTIRKKVTEEEDTSPVRCSDDGVVKDSDNGRDNGRALYSPTFTDKFDFVAALPNHPYAEIVEIVDERANMADKNSEELINDIDENVTIREVVTEEEDRSAVRRSDDGVVKDSDNGRVVVSPVLTSTARKVQRNSRRGTKTTNKSVMKQASQDQALQTEDITVHSHTSERERIVNENVPFGYLLIHDTYRSRYPSKIMLGSMNPFIRNL